MTLYSEGHAGLFVSAVGKPWSPAIKSIREDVGSIGTLNPEPSTLEPKSLGFIGPESLKP